ncbi:hypothetical protein B0O99DRAFT_75141 [Bisporella sp. PMI_857]|nr:hypothetical protein B0O99DRAFT_75141 [Bisporella sp. PMI_857]
MKGIGREDKIPEKFRLALQKASDGLLDGALFFSLSISSAGWVSFQYGQSYYEKLVFTSANVLALSALFAFLGIFTREGRKKRGDYILVAVLLGILTESAIQYIVYLREPNQRYNDYACLHAQFQYQGYHPEVFEALFFLLLGLSVIAGIVALIRMKYYTRGQSKVQVVSEADTKAVEKKRERIDFWVTLTRIFIQTVAIVVVWVELVYLWKIRNIMAKIAGDTWLEDEWGFGQILALFVWVPPIIDMVGWLVLKKEWLGGGESGEPCKCKFSEKGPSCQCLTMSSPHTEGDGKFGAQVIATPAVTTGTEKINDA